MSLRALFPSKIRFLGVYKQKEAEDGEKKKTLFGFYYTSTLTFYAASDETLDLDIWYLDGKKEKNAEYLKRITLNDGFQPFTIQIPRKLGKGSTSLLFQADRRYLSVYISSSYHCLEYST
jgi:hypothetical protein